MSYRVIRVRDEMRWGNPGSWHFSANLGMQASQMAAGGAAEECRWSGSGWEIELEVGRGGAGRGDFLKAKWGCTVW